MNDLRNERMDDIYNILEFYNLQEAVEHSTEDKSQFHQLRKNKKSRGCNSASLRHSIIYLPGKVVHSHNLESINFK